MKKSAHAHSALIQNRQFRARITRKECGHFNEVRRKIFFSNFIDIRLRLRMSNKNKISASFVKLIRKSGILRKKFNISCQKLSLIVF